MPVAHVALPVPLPRTFDYLLPEGLAPKPGVVYACLLASSRSAWVSSCPSASTVNYRGAVKAVLEVLDSEPVYSTSVWRLLLWAADYYHHPIGDVLFHALPILLRGRPATNAPMWYWFATEEGQVIDLNSLKRSPKAAAGAGCATPRKNLARPVAELEFNDAALQALRKKGCASWRAKRRALATGVRTTRFPVSVCG